MRDAMHGCERRVPPGRAQGRAALGRAPADHRHRQHARHAHGAEGRARRRRAAGRARVVEQRLRRRRAAADDREPRRTQPRSPYAVSKLAAEEYCRVFAELYGLETVALRYFNVYGPRQRPDATYAAVIPLFVDALLNGRDPVVHGDGLQSRDFTYISDVVDANLAAAAAPAERVRGPRLQHRRRARRRRCSTSCACSASCSASSRSRSSSNRAPATCATAAPTPSAAARDLGFRADGRPRRRPAPNRRLAARRS